MQQTQPTALNPALRRNQHGFALVVTVSLLVLLTAIAVGLLSLSTISLRAVGSAQDVSIARQNARLSLMLAIAELQKQTGPDTRITARADILDPSNPPLLGAWKSWEGTNHDTQGRPISPGNYSTKKQDRFLGWLTSASIQTTGSPSPTVPDSTNTPSKATLVGSHTVGSGADRSKLEVHLTPTRINHSNTRGAIAWWIGGENQKARLPKPYETDPDTPARWTVTAKSHSVADPAPFGLDDLLDNPEPANHAISLKQGDLLDSTEPEKNSTAFFHDLSAQSVGLLTNTATGGWRKDLSLLTENWDRLPSSLPLFQLKPGQDIISSKPTTSSPNASRSMLYPWSAYRGNAGVIPIYQHGAVASWHHLKDYATAYKRISASSSGRAVIPTQSIAIDDTAQTFTFLHNLRILPVIARVQWVFSHTAGTVAGSTTLLQPRLLVTPVITMWNPYNVEITSQPLSFNIPKPLPPALKYHINGTPNTTHHALTTGSNNYTTALSTADSLRYEIPTFTLKAGETRLFSPPATQVEATQPITLQQGYRNRGGHYFPVKNSAGATLSLPSSSSIKADVRFDTTYNDISNGVGIYLDMSIAGRRHLAYRMVFTPEVANQVYKPLEDLAATTLAAAVSNPAPFLSTIFGARMASDTHIAAKGFLQSSPLVNYTAMGSKDIVESTIARKYGGTSHPVNSPFDYSFIRHAPGGDSYLPNASDTSGRGYIVTGFSKADGLSRCVIAEIPTRPLQSLAELQNWDLRYENPIPPYALNLIGNSSASPLLPPNAVVNSADASLNVNLQHDDSYCANHLLFDDWFFSSISPDPTNFGASGKNLQKTYTDFITGVSTLGNRAYQAIPEDSANATPAKANSLYSSHVTKSDSWRTIASRLEVEGMFNVNSTSVTAWRALLGHARNQRVPYIAESGNSWRVETSEKSDYPFSRFTIAGDVESKSAGSSGAFVDCAEFAGYRLLDEDTLDQLAENIVAQIRARGPFLSLAEFINRQLSSGDLALAGTIQTALDQLAKGTSNNPYSALQAFAKEIEIPPGAEYQFPAAATGKSTFGLPGWTRQADVLRPLAPILSARDDTFTIRAYGDSRDASGNIRARAVCEAVVRRTRNMVDPADAPDATTLPTSTINRTFGRRYETISFRWLNPDEI